MRKNLLFVSSYPLPLEKGSNQHAFFFMKALAGRYDVFCLFFKQGSNGSPFIPGDHEAALSEIGIKDFYIVPYCQRKKVNKIQSRIQDAIAFPYFYAKSFNTANNRKLLRDLTLSKKIDLVHFESLHYAALMWYLPGNVKKTFVYHDLHHKIYFDQAKFNSKIHNKIDPILSGIKVRLFENMINKFSDLQIFLNPDEMRFSSGKAVHVPHIVNPAIKYQAPEKNVDRIKIFFLGGYNHPPNRVALDLIIGKILPSLSQYTNSDWEFHLIGKGTEKLTPLIQQKGLQKKIRLRGYVNDINAVFDSMDLALFPIPYGGGIKTKIIESMAAGIPVITTPSGVSGLRRLQSDCIAICDRPSEITESLVKLMDNEDLRFRQSQAARAYVEANHSYEIMRDILLNAYGGIA